MTSISSLEQKRLEEILREMHQAQKCSFFLEDVMGKVMDKLELTEEEAIELVRFLMNNHFISTGSFLPATFLRPGHIRMFPVVLTSKAIALVNSGQ
ncbi:MAG TPA: hypothetical protein DEF34_08130 [Desulfotomaculum sp.]|nr:MAG: hypothetical protein VR67_05765 [Peptococcaceae bacterium BRH_c8a]KJS70494.1 MAG: hypothetical protein JL56_16810 [Desulfotomaculum sp. BICA1-6]HBX23581.1 hypothetical protein [Desulfotomaculum sp.]